MNVLRFTRLAAALVAALSVTTAHAVTIDWVTVGNPGNASDPATGNLYGAVNYEYRIGKYEVTIQQYTDFLNAVAQSDPYSLYDTGLSSNLNIAGISRGGTSGSYTYSVTGPSGTTPAGASSPGNRPITQVSFYNAARFANWMHNGQGSGGTENGAYTISTGQIIAASRTNFVNTYTLSAPTTLSVGDQVTVSGLTGSRFNYSGVVTSVSGSQFTMANSGTNNEVATGTGSMTGASVTASSNATFSIPTENEWYKAAFYSPLLNAGAGGYYAYATQSDAAPGNVLGSGANQANYRIGSFPGTYSVTQLTDYNANQNYLNDVGAFTNSSSYYGTFDQSGNVNEWNQELSGTSNGSPGRYRRIRGGQWYGENVSSTFRTDDRPESGANNLGFRLVSPASGPSGVPEIDPAGIGSVMALVTGALGLLERRRVKGDSLVRRRE